MNMSPISTLVRHSSRASTRFSHSHMPSRVRRACDLHLWHSLAVGLLLAVVLVGCSSETSAPEPTTTTAAQGSTIAELRSEAYGETWPLIVSPIVVQCRQGMWVTFDHDGQTYNVTDPRPLPTWRDFSEVWAGADGEGLGDQATESMKSITPVIDAGLALC